MKIRDAKWLVLLGAMLLFSGISRFEVQAAPVIITQPVSQTNLVGSNVVLTVGISGSGPFTYQWLLNGTPIPNNLIFTIAGGGVGGDGGPATSASLNWPTGVAVDSKGTIYIAEESGNRVRRVDTNGVITTVAGNGDNSFSPDGILATNAGLQQPHSIALDSSGILYVLEKGNGRARKVDSNGYIWTVAGNGIAGFGGDNGPATNANLSYPEGIAIDSSGNILIADSGNARVRKVTPGGYITTLAGNGNVTYGGDGSLAVNASFNNGYGVTADSAGNVYISDVYNNRLREVDSAGIITTVAGNGNAAFAGDGAPATNASLYWPVSACVDQSGNIFIADMGNNRVRQMFANGNIGTVAGNGSPSFSGDGGVATNASLCNDYGLAVDGAGNLYIADAANGRIREAPLGGMPKWTIRGLNLTNAGNYSVIVSNASGSVTSLVAVVTVVFPPTFSVQPASQGVLAGSNVTLNATVTGTGPFQYLWYFNSTNLLQNSSSPSLTVNNFGGANIGSYTLVVTNAYAWATSSVAALTIGPLPMIVEQPTNRLFLGGVDAKIQVIATGLAPLYYSWYFDETNLLQMGTNSSLTISNFSIDDTGDYFVVVSTAYASTTSRIATLGLAYAPVVTTQPLGQTNFVGSNITFSVQATGTGPLTYQWQFNGTNLPNNIITTLGGNGSTTSGGIYNGDGGQATNAAVTSPGSLFVDTNGFVFFTDPVNNRIRAINPAANIYTWAGTGNGDLGDGGAALYATFWSPSGVSQDSAGNVYIADTLHERIRKVNGIGWIDTVAGGGGYFDCGDGGPAINACLHYPYAVAPDLAGNYFIADQLNNGIRKVDTNGIITTLAGYANATPGFSGDGGPAAGAGLFHPTGVALDVAGNLYIADYGNYRVRKVSTNGIISTVAGNGTGTYAGDGGKATIASLYYPSGIALDAAGNLFISDQYNNRVRKVDTNGNITTVAGNGSASFGGDGGASTNAGLNHPFGVALDGAGNLYIADQGNNRIREVGLGGFPSRSVSGITTNNNGAYTVIVSSPYGSTTSSVAALAAVLAPSITSQPVSQFVPSGGNGTLSVTVAGTGPFFYSWYLNTTTLVQSGANPTLTISNFNAAFVGQYRVVVSNAYAFATSQVATLSIPLSIVVPAIRKSPSGSTIVLGATVSGSGPYTYQWQFNGTNLPNNLIQTVAGNGTAGYAGDFGSAVGTSLNSPRGVFVDVAGNIYIGDNLNNRIRKVDTNGIIYTVAGTGTGAYSGDGDVATAATLKTPYGVVVDALGNLYFADYGNYCVRKVDTNGIIETFSGIGSAAFSGDGGAANGAGLNRPSGLAFDTAGNLAIADSANMRIREVDTNGIINTVAGKSTASFSGDGGAATNATMNTPFGVAFDGAGNLYIVDTFNSRIRRVSNGIITTVAGNGVSTFAGDGNQAIGASVSSPRGVAVDKFGNLFIADTINNRIRKVSTNGIITTIAGNGTAAFGGDGGAPTNASLNRPYAVATDSAGNVFVADSSNHRVREVFLFAGYPTLTLPNIGTNNVGLYRLVVSSPYGSTTSSVTSLTLGFPQPEIITNDRLFGFQSDHFGFNLNGANGQTVMVDASSDLVNWVPIMTNTISTPPFYFSDPDTSNFQRRYYRARSP